MKKIKIIKASGKIVAFETSKLINSLIKAGVSRAIASNIATTIEETVFDGMTTKEIYKNAFSQLKKYAQPFAAKYKLKNAIMELGETGYPFEKYVAALLSFEGYETQVGVIVQGKCVSHEVDVIAQSKKYHFMCECKFHNKGGRYCSVKIPLYIQSRFNDVELMLKKNPGHDLKFHQGWIFTNTRFSSDAKRFGECVGLKLISWNYPANEGIKDRVDRSGVHPITSVTTLTSREKKALINFDKILCMDLCKNPELLDKIGVKETRHQDILFEASYLCNLTN